MNRIYLAIDLGAESGRVIAGIYDGSRLELEELHRFKNGAIKKNDSLRWDVTLLFLEIKQGIATGIAQYGKAVVSAAVDTWGVDYALFDEAGKMIEDPFHYRDSRTDGMMELSFSKISKDAIFEQTGIQPMFFNTLNQILSEVETRQELLAGAKTLLFMPDIINYWLCGKMANERTIASTSQLFNPKTQQWSAKVLDALNIPQSLFAPMIEPATEMGTLLPEVMEAVGATDLKIVSVGSHDTASAIAAVPAKESHYVFLSSGTWSLMGVETAEPIINEQSLALGFSNEGGVCDTIRLLKNISGLWLLQECKRTWAEEGDDLDYSTLTSMAERAEPFTALLDPDYAEFAKPGDMPNKINAYLKSTGQEPIEDKGTVARVILESIALKYREVFNSLEVLTSKRLDVLHIVGGGTQNKLLNQLASNAVNRPVVAGPAEATSAGNILMQLLATKEIDSLQEGRDIILKSFPTETYEPQDKDAWDAAFARFEEL